MNGGRDRQVFSIPAHVGTRRGRPERPIYVAQTAEFSLSDLIDDALRRPAVAQMLSRLAGIAWAIGSLGFVAFVLVAFFPTPVVIAGVAAVSWWLLRTTESPILRGLSLIPLSVFVGSALAIAGFWAVIQLSEEAPKTMPQTLSAWEEIASATYYAFSSTENSMPLWITLFAVGLAVSCFLTIYGVIRKIAAIKQVVLVASLSLSIFFTYTIESRLLSKERLDASQRGLNNWNRDYDALVSQVQRLKEVMTLEWRGTVSGLSLFAAAEALLKALRTDVGSPAISAGDTLSKMHKDIALSVPQTASLLPESAAPAIPLLPGPTYAVLRDEEIRLRSSALTGWLAAQAEWAPPAVFDERTFPPPEAVPDVVIPELPSRYATAEEIELSRNQVEAAHRALSIRAAERRKYEAEAKESVQAVVRELVPRFPGLEPIVEETVRTVLGEIAGTLTAVAHARYVNREYDEVFRSANARSQEILARLSDAMNKRLLGLRRSLKARLEAAGSVRIVSPRHSVEKLQKAAEANLPHTEAHFYRASWHAEVPLEGPQFSGGLALPLSELALPTQARKPAAARPNYLGLLLMPKEEVDAWRQFEQRRNPEVDNGGALERSLGRMVYAAVHFDVQTPEEYDRWRERQSKRVEDELQRSRELNQYNERRARAERVRIAKEMARIRPPVKRGR